MSFFDVFSEMLVILFCMAAGFLAHKLGYLSKQTDQNLCRLLLGIIVPCLILGSVSAGDTLPSTEEILSVLKVAIVYYGLGFCAATFVPHLLGGTVKQQCVWRYSLIFSNMAFIGYPVSVALFGQEALFYAVILVLPFNLLSYSHGSLDAGWTGKVSLAAVAIAMYRCTAVIASDGGPVPHQYASLAWGVSELYRQSDNPSVPLSSRFSAGRFAFWAGIYLTAAMGSGGLSTSDPSHYAVAAPEVDRYRHTSGG